MKFKEIIKEHNEIYFDNKDDLKEFLDLCTEENINWSSNTKANEWKNVYNYYLKYGNFICIRVNFDKNWYLTQGNNSKINFTYNDFKKLLNPFDLAEFLKDNGVRVLDEQQFNDMFNVLDKHNIKYKDIKDKWYSVKGNGVFYYSQYDDNLMTVYRKECTYVKNILSYQDFISIYNSNITNKKVEELNVTSLKQDIEKYLIRDKEATNSYNDLLDFIINVNNKYDLKLNI